MFSTLRLPFVVTMSTACVRRAARLVRALAGIYLARPDCLLTVAWTEGNQCVTGTRSWSLVFLLKVDLAVNRSNKAYNILR